MFRLPKKIKEDFKNYKDALNGIITGDVASARFKGIRVPWGIYSHRGGEVYMTRIRIPGGVVSPLHLKAMGQASNKFGGGILHITTRQDIQIHNVKIGDTAEVVEFLERYELSPRGGGGNTIRNITACPLSGICGDEVFDVRSYAVGLSEYFLSQESSFNLPRKFKIAFSGCSKDCGGCLVNDLGFLATTINGLKGFKVFTGGGMGANSRIGKLLEEFIRGDEIGYCAMAVKNVFYRKGNRKDKHHNRLRFLIEDIGFDEFKNLYKKEFNYLKENEYIVLRKISFEEKDKKEDVADGEIFSTSNDRYKDFLQYNATPHKNKDFINVELRIPQGNIRFDKVTVLADLENDFEGIKFRTSQNQNLFICGIRRKDSYKLFLKLESIPDDFLYPGTLLDIVCCKGSLTCNLGLCNSPGLSEELEKIIKEKFMRSKVFSKLDIKINGCPNACGQHPIGKLSLHGLVRRVESRPVPFYKFLLGGRREAEYTRFSEKIGIIPAKSVPAFMNKFLEQVEEEIDNCDVYEFLESRGKDIASDVLDSFTYVPSYTEDKNFYIDWGRVEEFSLAGIGPGECGAGVIDMIESDLKEAKILLEKAEKKDYCLNYIKKTLFFSARALLVVRGIEPKSETEAFLSFKNKFIGEGIASHDYSNITDVFNQMTERLTLEEKKEKFNYAKKFIGHINEIYSSMDSSFNFPQTGIKAQEKQASFLDLKGTPCPLNYVKAKLALESLSSGDALEILLDEGESITNVPKSLENDGHKILNIEKLDNFYRLLVKKK